MFSARAGSTLFPDATGEIAAALSHAGPKEQHVSKNTEDASCSERFMFAAVNVDMRFWRSSENRNDRIGKIVELQQAITPQCQ